jgi:molybdenum cofactor cytidylyltransferase
MTGVIILAAGGSSRLGQPKQNLLFRGKTLLQHAVETAQRSNGKPVFVVLGANAGQIAHTIDANIIFNKDWNEGMASAIRISIKELTKYPAVTSVILMLCDQPFVSAALLNALIVKQTETGKPIVACAYNGTLGVPVWFDRALFSELLLLQGLDGAKTVISAHPEEVATVTFEQGGIDIDTPADYERLTRQNGTAE